MVAAPPAYESDRDVGPVNTHRMLYAAFRPVLSIVDEFLSNIPFRVIPFSIYRGSYITDFLEKPNFY